MANYSNAVNQISTNPGAFPRSVDMQYPLIVDRTRMLTQSKCNIWRACILEATIIAFHQGRKFSVYNKQLSILQDCIYIEEKI